jgi:PAS domain S-box-containing protein
MFELSYYPVQDAWFYILVSFVLEGLAVYLWQYRENPGALPLVCGLMNRVIWLVSLVIIGTTDDFASKLFWAKIQQLTVTFVAVIWLVFILQVTGRHQWLNRRVLAALLIVPVVSLLLLLSNDWHGWYWQIRLDGEVLKAVRGVGNWLMLSYNFLLIFAILYFCGQWIRQCIGLRRRQALIIVLAPASGLIGNSIWLFIQHSGQTGLLSPMPLSSLISGIVWTYGFAYFKIFNILPLAQAAAVNVMGNGLAVVDTKGWVVDLNAAAARILGVTQMEIIGKRTTEAFAIWPQLAAAVREESTETKEICLDRNNTESYYELHIVKLTDKRGRPLGTALVWKDITEQKTAQARLLEHEKAISILTERNRIGREIHDGQGQMAGYLQLQLQTIQTLLAKNQPEQAQTQVNRLKKTARQFNTDVRETIAKLKTGTSAKQSFLSMLKEYIEGYEKNYGIATRLILPEKSIDAVFSPSCELQLLRIIQEALTNVRKHAKAQHVQIEAALTAAQAEISVTDDGQGFDSTACLIGKSHYGLEIMKERAKEAGGELFIHSKPGAGTKISVQISLQKVENHENIIS